MQRYPYKYLDSWERLNNEILPEKKGSYSNLTMKDTIDADYNHAKRVWEDFGIENLYVQSDTFLLEDIFESFWTSLLKSTN